MMRIKHNIAALNSHRNLVNNNDVTNKTLQRLSSGMKINQAADGPASLTILKLALPWFKQRKAR